MKCGDLLKRFIGLIDKSLNEREYNHVKFNEILIEKLDHEIKFHSIHNHNGLIDGYIVEREDGINGSLTHLEGHKWR